MSIQTNIFSRTFKKNLFPLVSKVNAKETSQFLFITHNSWNNNFWASLMLSFIYKSRKKCSTISELKSLLKYFSIWYLFVTPSKNGEKFKPKKSDVKRFTITSDSISSMLLIHRNLRKSVLYNNSNVQKRRFDITRQHIFVRHKSNQNGKYVWEEAGASL